MVCFDVRLKMKTISIAILTLLGPVILGWSQDDFRVPKRDEAFLKATQLATCFHGHKTLKDVPIVYGRPTPEAFEKVRAGDLILGGSFVRERPHWVVCDTCRLRYEDNRKAWFETKEQCTEKTARKILTDMASDFPVRFGDQEPKEIRCGRWLGDKQIAGAFIALWTDANEKDIVVGLNHWAPNTVRIEAPKPDGSGRALKEFNWNIGGIDFELRLLRVFERDESHVHLEWRRNKKAAEQDGAEQPATAPESKPEGNSKPQLESKGRSQ